MAVLSKKQTDAISIEGSLEVYIYERLIESATEPAEYIGLRLAVLKEEEIEIFPTSDGYTRVLILRDGKQRLCVDTVASRIVLGYPSGVLIS